MKKEYFDEIKTFIDDYNYIQAIDTINAAINSVKEGE